jgi:nitrite reductase/ring-hydroxylating ferredoxin subunit
MWIIALKERDLRENLPARVYPKGIAVLLIRSGGLLHAVAANCPHMGCSLGGAVLDGQTIQCPCHDWRFDIVTGCFIDAPEIRLETFPLKIENGNVYINLEKERV